MKVPDKLKQLRSGKLDLCEYLKTVCDGIESKESQIEAFVPGTFDRDRILETANELVTKYPHPPDRPAVFGLPIGVKDIFRVHGSPTRCGSRLPASLFEGVEASCVSKLRQAGAIIMGKTVTAEFAGLEPGATRNPHNFAHTPGGSSSGSAAGVAAEYFALALGTQTSGSITRPAAYCGVIGLKPSFGRIPRDGVILYSPSADHVGIFVKDADLISAIMPVLVEDWKIEKKDQQKKWVVGLPDGPYLKQATQRTLDHFFAQMKRLEQNGWIIKRIPLFEDIARINKRHNRLITGEVTRIHAQWYQEYTTLYSRRMTEDFSRGGYISDEELNDLRGQRLDLRKQIQETMDDQQIDCWACPSATDLAPRGLSSTGDPIMNVPWSNSGLPTLSVPSGFDPSGLPHGIQLVGKFMQDEDLVHCGEKLEKDLKQV
jgi:Asp-tRNA(Asn)/Glu-tRNA(Gln) amidotransferase A subunit family amidase